MADLIDNIEIVTWYRITRESGDIWCETKSLDEARHVVSVWYDTSNSDDGELLVEVIEQKVVYHLKTSREISVEELL